MLTAVSPVLGSSRRRGARDASILADRVKALAAAVFLWLVLGGLRSGRAGRDGALVRLALQSVLFPALLLNPVDLSRVLDARGRLGRALRPHVGGAREFPPRRRGRSASIRRAFVQTAVPLVVAARVFSRRDWVSAVATPLRVAPPAPTAPSPRRGFDPYRLLFPIGVLYAVVGALLSSMPRGSSATPRSRTGRSWCRASSTRSCWASS